MTYQEEQARALAAHRLAEKRKAAVILLANLPREEAVRLIHMLGLYEPLKNARGE